MSSETIKITRIERLDIMKVRTFCIKNNFYSAGTNEAYDRMFRRCEMYRGELELLRIIATDIYDHTTCRVIEEMYGLDPYDEIIGYLMQDLLNEATRNEISVETAYED